VRSTLTAAFLVGNVDAQLLRGDKKDDPYAGLLRMIDTYRQMQRKNVKLKIPEVEKFIDMEKHGKTEDLCFKLIDCSPTACVGSHSLW
jgi:hypothetical protein